MLTNLFRVSAGQVIREYARRFLIEECFKDSKRSHRGGLRLRGVHLTRADRWNQLWAILIWAYAWLSGLGRWAEDTGFARYLRANTVRHRTHAVWKVGFYLWRDAPPELATLLPWQQRLLLVRT